MRSLPQVPPRFVAVAPWLMAAVTFGSLIAGCSEPGSKPAASSESPSSSPAAAPAAAPAVAASPAAAAPAAAAAVPELQFDFTSPAPDTEFDTAKPITLTGTHNLNTDAHVWMFLLDTTSGYYLQNPPIDLLKGEEWEVSNIRPNAGIRAIVAVYVDDQGHKQIQDWVSVDRWGKISSDEVKGLHGYQELARLRIVTPSPE